MIRSVLKLSLEIAILMDVSCNHAIYKLIKLPDWYMQ